MNSSQLATDELDYDQALQRFGLAQFRSGQREVIETIVAGHDCMCIMPTGGGKSLCYQLPSLIRPGLTIVVSPLIALMKDQVDNLGKRGIPATLINSTLSASEQQQRLQDVAAGKYQLVYVAPERLRNGRFLEAIRATPIQLLAIDEAHCISQWGHDFRPDYTRIGQFREWLGGVQTVALTATATPRVRDDIIDVLKLRRPRQFMSGFARPNLHFGVVSLASDREKDDELEQFLRRIDGAGIIYAATRKRCEAIVELLQNKLRMSVGAYHAGLQPEQRRAIQERFMTNELRIIVATNAFGMGIDKPDLRFVVHYNMPGSLEAYYQEAGRAGRDGMQSVCVMLYSYQDRYIQEFFIENNYPARDVIERVYGFLVEREEDPIELTLEEIRDAVGLNVSPEAVGSALQIIGRTSVLERLETSGGLAIIRIDSNLPTLVELLPKEATIRRRLMRLLERVVGERRYEQVHVHPRWLLQESGLSKETLARGLRELSKLEEFDYIPPFRGRAIHFLKRGVPFADLEIDFENLRKRKEAEYDRLNQVVNFAQSPLCRQATILRYFGDDHATNCEQCDRCGRSPGWPRIDLAKANGMTASGSMATRSAAPTNDAAQTDNHGQTPVQAAASPAPVGKGSGTKKGKTALTPEQQLLFLSEVVDAIQRIHGRLGKILIAQYLCGSQNAKLQKLNLHRLGSFGLLGTFRQSDAINLLDELLGAGILKQQEVNWKRPTISVAAELTDAKLREQLLCSVPLSMTLSAKIISWLSHRVGRGAQAKQLQSKQDGAQVSLPDRSSALPSSAISAGSPALMTANSPITAGPGDPLRSTTAGVDSAGAQASLDDWEWTVKLFQARYNWCEVLAIRRMQDMELADSLCLAARNGSSIDRSWLSPPGDDLRSAGQQRVLRELQRRNAAGVE
jgi:ATP-dependent DNA helicase RecQ